jgi:hypothetical protein
MKQFIVVAIIAAAAAIAAFAIASSVGTEIHPQSAKADCSGSGC